MARRWCRRPDPTQASDGKPPGAVAVPTRQPMGAPPTLSRVAGDRDDGPGGGRGAQRQTLPPTDSTERPSAPADPRDGEVRERILPGYPPRVEVDRVDSPPSCSAGLLPESRSEGHRRARREAMSRGHDQVLGARVQHGPGADMQVGRTEKNRAHQRIGVDRPGGGRRRWRRARARGSSRWVRPGAADGARKAVLSRRTTNADRTCITVDHARPRPNVARPCRSGAPKRAALVARSHIRATAFANRRSVAAIALPGRH